MIVTSEKIIVLFVSQNNDDITLLEKLRDKLNNENIIAFYKKKENIAELFFDIKYMNNILEHYIA